MRDRWWAGPRSALQVPAFRSWFLAQACSAAGAYVQLTALSWELVARGATTSAVAAVTVFLFVPVLVLGPVTGRLVDRVSRRRLLIGTQSGFLIVSGAASVPALTGGVSASVCYLLAGLTGLLSALDGPARQAYVNDLVEGRELAAAVALYEVVVNAARAVGPATAAALLTLTGAGPCLALNSAAFVPALVSLTRHHIAVRAGSGAASTFPAAEGGLRALTRRGQLAVLVGCLVVAGATGLVTTACGVLLPVMARDRFHSGAGGYGLLATSFGLGSLLGACAAALGRVPPAPMLRSIGVAILVAGLMLGASGLMGQAPWVGVAIAGGGAAMIWAVARANTLLQLLTPAHRLGHALGLWNAVLPGLNPIFALALGATADTGDPTSTLVGVGALTATIGIGLAARSVGRPAC